nr:unnamed protein product [Callosobruchus chinensis]
MISKNSKLIMQELSVKLILHLRMLFLRSQKGKRGKTTLSFSMFQKLTEANQQMSSLQVIRMWL